MKSAGYNQRNKRAGIHRDCVHSSVGRDVATKGYHYKCLMTDEPSFGLATHVSTGYLVCILQRHAGALVEARGELDHWKWVDSPYCLRLYDRFHVGNFHYFITDPVVSGNVRNAFERNAPKDVTGFLCLAAHHLLSALRDIHAAGFVHLDFNWSQVWMDANHHLYLGGFHNLMPVKRAAEMGVRSYPAYAPPELLAGTGPYTDKADVWSVGVGILELLTGEWIGRHKLLANANDESPSTLLRDIHQLLPSLRQRLLDQKVDPWAADFLVRVLKYDPIERPTAADALRHSWFLDLRRCMPWKSSASRLLTTRPSVAMSSSTERPTGSMTISQPKVDSVTRHHLLRYGYELLDVLHSGFVSTIFHARCIFDGKFGDRDLAIKRKKQNKAYSGEMIHWQTIRHPAILRLMDVFHDGTGHVFFATVLMTNGNASKYLREADDDERRLLRRITTQMVDAMLYLHDDVHMVHMNFTWSNVLIDGNGNAKLADFRFLQSRSSGPKHQQEGDRLRYGRSGFQAPETFIQPGVNRALLDRVDTWALGANLFELVCDKSIAGKEFDTYRHKEQNNWKTYCHILDNLVKLPNVINSSKIDKQMSDFILQLLVFRPEVRMSAARARGHTWLRATVQPPESTEATRKSIDTWTKADEQDAVSSLHNKSTTYADDNEEVEWPPATLFSFPSPSKGQHQCCRLYEKESREKAAAKQECTTESFTAVRAILISKDWKNIGPVVPPQLTQKQEMKPAQEHHPTDKSSGVTSSAPPSSATSPEMTPSMSSSDVTPSVPPSDVTPSVPPSDVTSSVQSSEVTFSAISSEVTSSILPSEVTASIPSSEVTASVPSSSITTPISLSDITASAQSSDKPREATRTAVAVADTLKADVIPCEHKIDVVRCHRCRKLIRRP